MTSPVGRPVFPVAPASYDMRWGNNLTRSLETSFSLITAVQPVYGTTLNLSALPTSGVGLAVGDVFIENGLLKIVQAGEYYPNAASITLAGYAPEIPFRFGPAQATVTIITFAPTVS